MNMSEKTEAGSGYMNSMCVELELGGMLNMSSVRRIEGTVFGRDELRITQVDGFNLDLPPGEHMLLFNNYDEPGVLRRVVEKLATANVNIAHFSLGRKEKGQMAMSAVVLDSAVPPEVITSLAGINAINNLVAVSSFFFFVYFFFTFLQFALSWIVFDFASSFERPSYFLLSLVVSQFCCIIARRSA